MTRNYIEYEWKKKLAETKEEIEAMNPGNDCCSDKANSIPSYYCTRKLGHKGRHIAAATSFIIASWE